MQAEHPSPWWQTGTIYQIYPRSFMDKNGDGVGDLPGITQQLDYLKWLGVQALWLSPIYPSPMADFGYDISDYTDVHPLFGTLSDLDQLITEAHARDLKVTLDFVPNHTSDEHPWFINSRSSRSSEQRDWYIWHDPAPDGGVPNNWTSLFGGPAWEFDEQTGQYYLHLFDVKQPDLNWRNPAVRTAMSDILRFWMKRGIDGFRVDALGMLLKDDQWRDNPLNPDWKPGDRPSYLQHKIHTEDQPGLHDIIREIRSVIDEFDGRVFIGEIYLPVSRLIDYYGIELDEAHLPFNFQLVELKTWTAQAIQDCVESYERLIPAGAWPNWVLGNHDRPRIASRVGHEQARVAQMLLLTLRGTPTLYYGDELGMQNGQIPIEMMHDPEGKENPTNGRDAVRTPMQWNQEPNAGFSPPHIQTWLPVSDGYQQYNVIEEQDDKHSHLTLARTLLGLRKSIPALNKGTYRTITQENPNCFVYQRADNRERYLIILNCTTEEQIISNLAGNQGEIILSTYLDKAGSLNLRHVTLRKNEGYLIKITSREEKE